MNSRAKSPQNNESNDPPKPVVDIDAIVTENKYLHDRITQLQVEKEIAKRNLTKYKVCNVCLLKNNVHIDVILYVYMYVAANLVNLLFN